MRRRRARSAASARSAKEGLDRLGARLGTLLSKLPAAVVRFGSAAVFLGFGLALLLSKPPPAAEPRAPTGRLLFASFSMVFLAEFGDATQLASAALVARLGAPWSVFAG